MKALGMIEVRGYLGAVSATDAALKAADVELNNAEIIRGGLTTVELIGDVAAVNAAVDAGVVVAKELNCLISHHVIARLDEQTQLVTTASKKRTNTKTIQPAILAEQAASNAVKDTHQSVTTDKLRETLSKEKVVDLRKRAYQMNIKTLKKSEIKFANKQTLIEAIATEIERSE